MTEIERIKGIVDLIIRSTSAVNGVTTVSKILLNKIFNDSRTITLQDLFEYVEKHEDSFSLFGITTKRTEYPNLNFPSKLSSKLSILYNGKIVYFK